MLWTRGEGCEDLARLLGDAAPVDGDLRSACLDRKADLLVQRRLSSFDLVSTAVPQGFDRKTVTGVVAAVGGGPHSQLAASAAERLAESLGVGGRLVTGARGPDEREEARHLVETLAGAVPGLVPEVVEVEGAGDLVDALEDGMLLVVGAPGGSWFQRQFFGPGRQLIRSAPGGVIVVRSSPRRCFQAAEPVEALSPHLPVEEAIRLAEYPLTPVADEGRLVGLFRNSPTIEQGTTVGEVMSEGVFVSVDDPIDAVAEVAGFFDGSPVPVVDRDGSLSGAVTP